NSVFSIHQYFEKLSDTLSENRHHFSLPLLLVIRFLSRKQLSKLTTDFIYRGFAILQSSIYNFKKLKKQKNGNGLGNSRSWLNFNTDMYCSFCNNALQQGEKRE